MNLPENKIATLLNDTYDAHVSVGTVAGYLKKAAELFGDEYERIKKDFYPSYDGAPGRKQKCWSHLIVPARKLVKKKQPPPESVEFYEGLLQIFKDAKAAVRGLETEEERSRVYADFVERLEQFVTEEGKWQHHKVKRLAKRAFKYLQELFTFILVPGVEPTNNVSERALRP